MKNLAYPYPTLFPYIKKPFQWSASVDDNDERFFQNGVGDWDYNSKLKLIINKSWDIENTFKESGLSTIINNSRFAIVISTGSSDQTGIRYKVLDKSLLEISKNKPINIPIDSKFLCKQIKARLIIYCTGASIEGIKIRNGSILFKEEALLSLEGDLASFSIRETNFSKNGWGEGLWYINFNADSLSDTFLSTTTLWLNTEQQSFISQLQSEEDRFLKWIVKADVISTVISSILLSDDFEQLDLNEEYPINSLGLIVGNWIKLLDIDSENALSQLKQRIKENPGEFKRQCQAITSFVDGEQS